MKQPNTLFVVFFNHNRGAARKKQQRLPAVESIDRTHTVVYMQFLVNVVNMFSYCLGTKK